MFSDITNVLNKQHYQSKRGIIKNGRSSHKQKYIFSTSVFLLLLSTWLTACAGINIGGTSSTSADKWSYSNDRIVATGCTGRPSLV